MSESVSLADVEQLCWRLSGWKVEQRDVDRLLTAVRGYAGTENGGAPAVCSGGCAGAPERAVESPEPPPAPVESPTAPTEALAAVQHVHVTGTLTLAWPPGWPPAPQAPALRTPQRRPERPVVMDGTKHCHKCERTLPVERFARDKKGHGGRRARCRDCESQRKRDARVQQKAPRR